MLSESQLAERQNGIGGSDMAALLGLDKYRQPIDIFYSKRPDLVEAHGFKPQQASGDAVDFGHYVEPAIAELYAKRTGRKVRQRHQTARRKEYPFLAANIDRKIVGEKRILECKSANWRLAGDWGEEGTDQVAEYYLPQLHHYLLVLDYPVIDLAVLIGGASDFRIYTVERDREWDEILIETGRKFWEHVERGEPPEILLEPANATEVLKRAYTNIEGEVWLPEKAATIHEALQHVAEERKELEKTEEGLKNMLKRYMGNAGVGRIPGIDGAWIRKRQKRAERVMPATEFITFRFSSKA